MNKELELENKFIQLWNDGKSYDEISEEIGVNIEKIRQWGTDLIIANNSLFDEKKYVYQKSDDGKYVSTGGNQLIKRLLFKIVESKTKDGVRKSSLMFYPLPGITRYPKYSNKIGVICISSGNRSNLPPITAPIPEIEKIDFEDLINKYEFQAIKLPPIFNDLGFEELFNSPKENKDDILPITVTRFSFKEFKGIKSTKIGYLPKSCQWIFLTGDNGYGKSTILKAIALGLSEEILNYQEGNFRTRLGIEYEVFSEFGTPITKNTPYTSVKINKLQKFAAYGPHRISLQDRESQNEKTRRSDTLYNINNSDGILYNIEYRLFISSLKDNQKFKKIKNLLLTVIPNLYDIIVNKEEEEIYYIENSQEGKPFKPVKFDELAVGYKSVIAMVGDIYIRLSKNQPDAEIIELGGIVLIDELDVHLHPKWQRKLPKLLSDAFPKVQFIASTHSPIPFLGAPKNAVFLKVDRTPEEGITCERIDIDVTNLTPNLILTSPIFGFDEIVTDGAKNNISEVHTEGSYKELKENEALRNRLLEFENSDRDFPDELFEQKTEPSNPTETQ